MLDLEHISLSFSGEKIIEDLSFSVKPKQKVVIQAPSGKGKTTLIHLILGFLKPDAGRITLNDRPITDHNIKEIRTRCAWLPQNLQLGEGTVEQVIFKPFEFKMNMGNKPGKDKVIQTLRRLGLEESILEKDFVSVSEGQKQRIGLAICYLLNRDIILLDEPTSSLDAQSKEKVIDMFLHNPNLTIISTSHDEQWVHECGRIISL